MKYFYKLFDSSLATCKLTGYDATSFPGLEKLADYTKDPRQRMDTMCLIKTADSKGFSCIWNELENGTILEDFTNMYHKTIAKAYGMMCKYKRSTNTT